MLIFAVYAVTLVSPLLLFGVITLVCNYQDRRERRSVRVRLRRHRAIPLDPQRAVLEAQFIVAPHIALREARSLLGDAPGDALVENSEPMQEAFERLLTALTRAGQGHHVAPAG